MGLEHRLQIVLGEHYSHALHASVNAGRSTFVHVCELGSPVHRHAQRLQRRHGVLQDGPLDVRPHADDAHLSGTGALTPSAVGPLMRHRSRPSHRLRRRQKRACQRTPTTVTCAGQRMRWRPRQPSASCPTQNGYGRRHRQARMVQVAKRGSDIRHLHLLRVCTPHRTHAARAPPRCTRRPLRTRALPLSRRGRAPAHTPSACAGR